MRRKRYIIYFCVRQCVDSLCLSRIISVEALSLEKNMATTACTVLCEFGMNDRVVSLVAMPEGKLGIMVTDEHGSHIIPLESDFPGMTFAHAPLIVKGAMALMVMTEESDPEIFIRCFHAAVIMANADTDEKKFELLSSICDEVSTSYIIAEGWGAAIRFADKFFQGKDKAELEGLCALHFPDERALTMQ